MRILFLSSFLLFPESRSGAAKRLYYFARILAREHEVSLVCLDAGEEAAAFREETQPAQKFLQVRYERTFLDKFRDPFDVPQYLDPAMAGELDRFIRDSRFDVVFGSFAFALSLIQLPALRDATNIVYLEDDLSFAVFRERSRKATSLKRKLHMGARWLQAEAFYRRLMPRVRGFISISEEEAAVVREKFPHCEVTIVGYGIPLEDYPLLPPPADARVLGFIGNYIHQSNIDAMFYFLAEWFPALQRDHPDVRVEIAGKNLPPEVVAAGKGNPNVIFRDNVPDLGAFYAGISIFVNPIVSQRGLRTKLVESAAYGRPIISTRLGAEGLEDLRLELADSTEEFLQAYANLREPPALARTAADGRATVERLYSIEAIGRTLADALARHARPTSPA